MACDLCFTSRSRILATERAASWLSKHFAYWWLEQNGHERVLIDSDGLWRLLVFLLCLHMWQVWLYRVNSKLCSGGREVGSPALTSFIEENQPLLGCIEDFLAERLLLCLRHRLYATNASGDFIKRHRELALSWFHI